MTDSVPFFSYFPQYHSDPVNDQAWGAGFTDWDLIRDMSDVRRPGFTPASGMYDPSAPGYLPQLEAQLRALPFDAGLMVYHYHFDGRHVLPGFEKQLLAQRSALPFFLCWANETWSKRWVGKPGTVILEQQHRPNPEVIAAHARHLASCFELPGYKRHHGRPLLLIYNPQASASLPHSLDLYRQAFAALGQHPLIGACISHPQPSTQMMPYDFGCEFEPRFFFNTRRALGVARLAARVKAGFPKAFEWLGAQRDRWRQHAGGREFFYDQYLEAVRSGEIERELRNSVGALPLMRSTFLTWDNTPRYRTRSTVVTHEGVDAAALRLALTGLCSDNGLPLLVNSWNEWSEGAALEGAQADHRLLGAFLEIFKAHEARSHFTGLPARSGRG